MSQFRAAITLGPVISDEDLILEDVTLFQAIYQFFAIFWRVAFATVPPPNYWNGYGCFVVSLLEMCRSQATNLMTQQQFNPDERLAKVDSKTSASIAGRSFDEAIMQNELYRQHELKTGFEKYRIRKAKSAFDEAVEILE